MNRKIFDKLPLRHSVRVLEDCVHEVLPHPFVRALLPIDFKLVKIVANAHGRLFADLCSHFLNNR